MSTPRDIRFQRRARTVRLLSLGIVVAASAGLVGLSPLAGQSADAATDTASAVTVKWNGDASALAKFQPQRDAKSPHFTEFDDLSITVSQTEGIIDQTIRVGVSGFAGTRSSTLFGQNVMNYLQAMQCWGEDPLEKDFVKTCQWGGMAAPNNGVGGSVIGDNLLRISTVDADPIIPTTVDNPFVTAQGRTVSAKPYADPDGSGPAPMTENYPILDYFNPATTNEVTSVRVGADGSGFFDFETQSADQAPQLGCGNAAQRRCWLVIVPRGTVFGGLNANCSTILDPANNNEPYSYGRPNSLQGGSPINPDCDYWKNRVVAPLDFNTVGSSCAVGSAEQRVIGSQLMVGAMSSWQPDLCQTLKATYSFSSNPDSIARNLLLEGAADVAFVGAPLNAGELDTNEDRQRLADSQIIYAPVAVSGVSISFLADFSLGRVTELTLSPRLVAKLLTQSYIFTVPWNESDPAKNFAHLPAQNRKYEYLNQDPEFRELNPKNFNLFTQNPAIVLPGPSGADAIRQIWKWMLADKDAVAFLNGVEDPLSKMTVNPYYLAAGSPNAQVPTFDKDGAYVTANGVVVTRPVGLKNIDGSPMKLSESTIDTFMKADESKVPLKVDPDQSRFDSIQFAPYTDNLLTAARQTFRANPNSRTIWDPTRINSAGVKGDWVSSGPQPQGAKFMISITDTPSTYRYGLTAASLRLANSTTAVTPNSASMSAALTALRPTSLDAVKQVDPAAVTAAAYPITMVSYAAVNLTSSDATSRTAISRMLTRVTTTGQLPGTVSGQLPPGYVPITADMATQTRATVDAINAFVPRAVTAAPASIGPTNGIAQDSSYTPNNVPSDGEVASSANEGGGEPELTSLDEPVAEVRTTSIASAAIARTGLAASLGFGLLGAIFGPILFRGRGLV